VSERSTRFGLSRALLLGALAPSSAYAFPTNPGDLTNPLEPAESCQACHHFDNPVDLESEPPVSPFQWAGTMMGNSARDPVFWAGVAIASQDLPGATEECVRCHSPRAFLEGRGDAVSVGELLDADREGITCDLCHRAYDDGTPLGNAHYAVDDAAVNGEVPKRGPWTYSADHEHEWSNDNAFMASSALCGVCHDVTTPKPRVDAMGIQVLPGFNEQRTYSEWLNSTYAQPGEDAQGCADCHMPAYADGVGCEQYLAEPRHPTGARRHDLVGANRFMLGVMGELFGAFGTDEVFDSLYADAIERLDAFLPTAASLDVTFPSAVDLGTGFELPIRVTNETGHKLPTGYSEGRVMWIETVATYGDSVLWSSGRWDDAAQEIEDDAQVRRYEAIAEDSADGTTLHLLLNDRWVVDNRIPPAGMIEDVQTDPVGDRYTATAGVWPNYDDFAHVFDALDLERDPSAEDELTVEVRLLYVVNTREYIEFLEDENVTNSAGSEIRAAFESRGWSPPMVIQSAGATIPLSGFAATEGTASSAGTEDAGSTAGTTETDAGAAGEGPGGGCSCTTTGSGRATPLFSLGALLLVGVGRRRTKRTRPAASHA
jgi:MYXO-CTERM domain-containing protein